MSVTIVLFVFFLLICQNVKGIPSLSDSLVVETKVGNIKGFQANDGQYFMFLGIPYGKVNKLNPFGPSTPYPTFNETFEAYDDSAVCAQLDGSARITGDLDCLHLSIFVPKNIANNRKLPVLVYIHGGAFQTGSFASSMQGPKFLVRNDIIVVTLNYRVGLYGFLCLDIPEVPGNQGLKDQRLALRWIKENIEFFGGDLDQMTLAGSSAGGKSVDFHLHLTKEIPFRNYILQSGTVLLPHLEKEVDPSAPLRLVEIMGFKTNDVIEALKFLTEAGPAKVLAAATQLDRFEPCYEKVYENVESFLTDYSINLDSSNVKGKNIILGFNEDEWMFRHTPLTNEDYKSWNGFLNELYRYFNFDEVKLKEMSEVMKRFYIGDEDMTVDVKLDLSYFDSDFLFIYPCDRTIDKFLESGINKIYYYKFTYVGGRNLLRMMTNTTIGGATHGDELGYMFDVAGFGTPAPNDQLFIDRMTTMWANFVKYGDPTPEISLLLPVKWEPITSNDSPRYYLDMGSELTLGRTPLSDRLSFWKLFYSSNKELQRGYRPKVETRDFETRL